MIPVTIGRPSASLARRLVRSSSLTVRLTQPDARSAPSVSGRPVGSTGWRVTGGERTTEVVEASNVDPGQDQGSRRTSIELLTCPSHRLPNISVALVE